MDVLHDNSLRTFVQLGNQHAVPAYVGSYELPTEDAVAKMANSEFADDSRRLFPIGTPALTWLSAGYFAKNAAAQYDPEEIPFVREQIQKAASIYGIRADVDAIMAAVGAPVVKAAAAPESVFMWLCRDAAGNVTRSGYPIYDSDGVKLACEYFGDHRHEHTPEERKQIATNILHKAAEYGATVSGAVLREAGQGVPSKDFIMAELLNRAERCQDIDIAMKLASVNEAIAAASAQELADSLDKVAALIDDFDRTTGMDREYRSALLMPADIVYSLGIKEAEEWVADSVELNRYVFSLKKLAELPLSTYGDVLGADFANAVKSADNKVDATKLSDNLFSLPRPERVALEDHLVATCN